MSEKIYSRQVFLPVSGRRVELRAPTGAEDLLLLESGDDDLAMGLELMTALARPVKEQGSMDWGDLTPTDLDVWILRLRQSMLGDRVMSDVRCGADQCKSRVDISFGIDQYLGHHLPSQLTLKGRGWSAEPTDKSGWLRLNTRHSDGAMQISFRLPTVVDLLAVAGSVDGAEELAARCIRPADVPARQRRWVERAMESIAPALSQDLQGVCPDCGAEMAVFFDPRRYCLRELRDRASFVYQDIDALARRYHWTESDILAMPRMRRMQYAETARSDGDR